MGENCIVSINVKTLSGRCRVMNYCRYCDIRAGGGGFDMILGVDGLKNYNLVLFDFEASYNYFYNGGN